ncbi:ABC transporter permease [Paenibacillaceae bacterium WGS1546]|uniref:ABC transporter permease n=1 Tax=Cohnella sp. WGS1546 TaxID=3366810 RepID=UPI00372D60D0
MADLLQVAGREIKIGFRNPWSYSFLALFAVFSLSLLLIQSRDAVEGYSAATGGMLSLILYLLPLMTLFLGAFSLTSEKEDGSWQLLSTYPLSTFSFVAGKYAGLSVVLLAIVAFGYGLMGVVGAAVGTAIRADTYLLFVAFSAGLVLLFLSVAMIVGSLSRNRWQALTIGVALWFFLVIGWSTILIAGLGSLPYPWIKPALVFLTFCNPAELVRLFVVVKLGGGSVLGPEYYEWVGWMQGAGGTAVFLAACAGWIAVFGGIVGWIWERGRSRG